MKKLALAIAAILVAATPAPDHGGKIKWTVPKNVKEYDALIEACNAAGKPAFLYFTMDG